MTYTPNALLHISMPYFAFLLPTIQSLALYKSATPVGADHEATSISSIEHFSKLERLATFSRKQPLMYNE